VRLIEGGWTFAHGSESGEELSSIVASALIGRCTCASTIAHSAAPVRSATLSRALVGWGVSTVEPLDEWRNSASSVSTERLGERS
jgi:hypothetical protein